MRRRILGQQKHAESRLLALAKAGDRRAFDLLMAEYSKDLRRFLVRRVAEAEVDDVAQETWLSAWSALQTFGARSQFRTWLYSIAIHKCGSHYRREMASPSSAKETLSDDESYVEGGFEKSELQTVLGDVLKELPEAQREVLELYYFSEFNLKEIGEVLNRNLNTVKYQFYRAHAEAADRLKGVFDSKGYEASGERP